MKTLPLLLLLAGCAAPLPQTPPAGLPASVALPQIHVGDNWTYQVHDGYTKISRGTQRHTVTEMDAQRVTVEVTRNGEPARTEIYTREWNWLEKPMTNLQNFRYNPAYVAFPYPLSAGKTWRVFVQATDPAAGNTNRVRIDGSILGWERVKVPAGEFDTLKVRRLVYAGNANFDRGEEHIEELDWYSPQLGQTVKHMSASRYLDNRMSCDRRSCDNWISNDWNVVELVRFERVSDKPKL